MLRKSVLLFLLIIMGVFLVGRVYATNEYCCHAFLQWQDDNSGIKVIFHDCHNGDSIWTYTDSDGSWCISGYTILHQYWAEMIPPSDAWETLTWDCMFYPSGSNDCDVWDTLSATLPRVYVNMYPHNPPIYVPQGGHFVYDGELTNNYCTQVVVDVWIMIDVPGYGLYPGAVNQNIVLGPYETLRYNNIHQFVPGYAPIGEYEYCAYVGDYPYNVMDSSCFIFNVYPAAEVSKSGDWETAGWIDNENYQLPNKIGLIGSYPNPFNATTTITFTLPKETSVSLDIYDLLGRKVINLANGEYGAGKHNVVWDATDSPSGIYFYKLTAGNKTFTKRMTLLK